jgi:hypothetical protein
MDDVLLQIGPFPVASDATILYEGNRVSANVGFQFAQSGGSVPLKVWRAGKPLEVEVVVKAATDDQVEGNQYDVRPRYFVFGGLVFTPLSRDYLRDAARDGTDSPAPELSYELFYRSRELPETARSEPVVLSGVLADAVNANFRVRSRALVDKVNGVRIEKLEDLIRVFETSTNAYDLIEFARSRQFECLDHAQAARNHRRILETYGVPKDRHL